MNNPYSIAFRHNLRVQRIRHLRARGLNNIAENEEKNFHSLVGENADAPLSESLKEQARRHMPKNERTSYRIMDYAALGWAERAHRQVSELNAQIKEQAEARRQFVEATR